MYQYNNTNVIKIRELLMNHKWFRYSNRISYGNSTTFSKIIYCYSNTRFLLINETKGAKYIGYVLIIGHGLL